MKVHVILFCTLLVVSLSAKIPKGVKWHKGSVESAFAMAKKENKPLFLYWGAVWCPPCNQIKKTIFTKKQFHRESDNFISVYLDGDNANAQKWGEHFGAVGYPTMMILNSAGEEITRMPGGLDVVKYVDLMKKTRLNQLTILELFNKAKSKKATVSEYERLAGYSWGQDVALKTSLLSKEKKQNTFSTLYLNAPTKPSYLKANFFLRSELAKLQQNKDYQGGKKESQFFKQILSDEKAIKGNIGLLSYSPKEYEKMYEKSLGKKNFKALYLGALKKVRNDKTIDLNNRFSTLYPVIILNKKDKKIPAKIQAEVKKWTKLVDEKSKDAYSRQSNMTTAIWLLKTAGLIKDAKNIAIKELKVSISPFYIMRYLASIEMDLGNKMESLKWSKKAWDTAKGNATRFEWGTSYVLSLIKHSPKNRKEITQSTLNVFKELVHHEDAFKGRNKRRLERLKKKLSEWKKKESKAFAKLETKLKAACTSTKNGQHKKDCLSWI